MELSNFKNKVSAEVLDAIEIFGEERYEEGLSEAQGEANQELINKSEYEKWNFLSEKLKEVADGYLTIHDLYREAQSESCRHMPITPTNRQTLLSV